MDDLALGSAAHERLMLGVAEITVRRHWKYVRARLYADLKRSQGSPMEKSWVYPVVANGRPYPRDHGTLWCTSVR